MALELYDCNIFCAYSFPNVLRPSHVTFKIPAWEQKTWWTFLSFLVKKSIFWVIFCIKIRFHYISSEKYIFYFYNIDSVNVHNHSLARCCEDFSAIGRIIWLLWTLLWPSIAVAPDSTYDFAPSDGSNPRPLHALRLRLIFWSTHYSVAAGETNVDKVTSYDWTFVCCVQFRNLPDPLCI